MAEEEKLSGRVANFSAGPATLPEEVLLEVQRDLLNYKGHGMSVMEMSHRSKVFDTIYNEAIADCRELLNIPDNYHVFFLQGGATTMFSSIPLNLNLGAAGKPADYVVSGNWSKKATEEAQKYGQVNVAVSTMKETPSCGRIPPKEEWKLSEDAAYLHVCINETVHGVTMDPSEIPAVKCPVVADWSSSFMSGPIDVSQFAVIYAGAQKNVGPAGVTVAIVRDDMVGKADPKTPILMDWTTHKKKKIYNTPPCFSIYVMGLVFKWLKKQGGLDQVLRNNQRKAALIYDVIDEDDFYVAPVEKKNRSLMNIRFNLSAGNEAEARFLEEGEKLGFMAMKGYRTLGGIRISAYNAQPMKNCEAVAKFMREFRDLSKSKM